MKLHKRHNINPLARFVFQTHQHQEHDECKTLSTVATTQSVETKTWFCCFLLSLQVIIVSRMVTWFLL